MGIINSVKPIHFFEIRPHDRSFYEKSFKSYNIIEHKYPLNVHTASWAKECEIVCIFVHSKITAEIIDSLSKLKHIVTRSVGIDHIDKKACNRRGIKIWNIRDYGPHTVAEHTLSLMLAIVRNLSNIVKNAEHGNYYADPEKNRELKNKVLGIIGTGMIGAEVAKRAHAFDMKILAHDHNKPKELTRDYGVEFKSFQDVLKHADIITLHVPMTDENRHMINTKTISSMKKKAYVINTARGGLIDSVALLKAIQTGKIAGAGLDVLDGEEFIFPEHPARPKTKEEKSKVLAGKRLTSHPNVIVTPHAAFGSLESLQRIRQKTVEIIKSIC